MQHTVKKNINFSGPGIHSGGITNMTLTTAKEDSGIRLIRIELE